MTNIKMVATDIDGTILCYGHTKFRPAVVDCIKDLEKQGIKVILITGRMHASAKGIASLLDLNLPIVSYQGALVKDCEENILYERYIDNDVAKEILNWASKKNIDTNLYLDDHLFVEKESECTRRYTGEQKIPYTVDKFNSLAIDKVNKILLIDYSNEQIVSEWKEFLSEKYPDLYIVKSTPYFCEICHKEATKGEGLAFLQNYYGIKKEETLSIGDHNNDLELLLAGGVKVAMGNACDELKKVADFVTESVDNDGFVVAIDKFVNKEVPCV